MPLATAHGWAPSVITNAGIVGTTAPGTTLVSNATTLLDGAVTECITAANNIRDSWGISIGIDAIGAGATASESAVDILVGGATDDVLISALLVGGPATAGFRWFFFPLYIPSGLRIAALLASVRTSISAGCIIELHGGGVPPWRTGSRVTTYGTQINNARGLAVVPTASGGASSITEMTASTTEDHFAFLPGFQCSTDTTMGASVLNIAIAVGATVEERIGTWWFGNDASETQTGPNPPWCVFRDVPSGTRLTMLASNSSTNDAAYDGLIYAVS
jgi:hypothetical protein